MAMNKSTLGALMKSKVEALGIAAGTPMTDAAKLAYYEALADAIITHITSAAAVAGNVTSGAGAGGGVVGTVS